MAIIVNGCNPTELLNRINEEIRIGHIDTWIIGRGMEFTHIPTQWCGYAWMHPRRELFATSPQQLVFGIRPSNQHILTKEVYGVFHGRFAEMLVNHFDYMFTNLTVTSLLLPDVDFFTPHVTPNH